MVHRRDLLFTLVAASLALQSQAIERVDSGSIGTFAWIAQSTVVAATSTATGGSADPLFWPNYSQHSGVLGLRMDFTPAAGDEFVCSGSLMADRISVLTAAHCVTDQSGVLNLPMSTTAYFYGGPNVDAQVYGLPGGVVTVGVSSIFVNPQYTGAVIDDNDVAVLRLSSAAPPFAQSYGLYTGPLEGQVFNVAGYGRRGTSGSTGATLGTGVLRQGNNRFEYAFGDAAFAGAFTAELGPLDLIGHSWVSDFDSGLAANDTSCLVVGTIAGLTGSRYCNLGVGASEVGTAGGDSGGPQFIGGQVASVTSYSLTFVGLGDVDCLTQATCQLNSTFGEYNGFAPVYHNLAFIQGALAVPEAGSRAMLLLGLAAVGVAVRRRVRQAIDSKRPSRTAVVPGRRFFVPGITSTVLS